MTSSSTSLTLLNIQLGSPSRSISRERTPSLNSPNKALRTDKLSSKRKQSASGKLWYSFTCLKQICAVIGLPDALTGSSLACVCVPLTHATKTPHLQQAISTCVAARFGAPYRPKLVLLTSSLPKTRNEKIMRRVIRSVLSGAHSGDLSALVNPEAVAELQALAVSHEH